MTAIDFEETIADDSRSVCDIGSLFKSFLAMVEDACCRLGMFGPCMICLQRDILCLHGDHDRKFSDVDFGQRRNMEEFGG